MKFRLYIISIVIIGLFGFTSANFSGKQFSKIENVNIDKVKQERLKWHNQERTKNGLNEYSIDNNFNISAKTRSDKLAQSGKTKNLHQRSSKDGYYSYNNIKSRFTGLGVNFEDVSGTLFTESIGRGYYKCNKPDCTQDLIKSIKSTFNFFMSEKGKKRKPHYNGIVSQNFSNIGVGISLDNKTNRYFLVSHYGVNTINISK